MAEIAIRKVYWKGKFGGDQVSINAAAFNPEIHSDQPWEKAAPTATAKAKAKAK